MKSFDTVLPERILRRYRRLRLRVPHWVKRSLAIGAWTLSGVALICVLAFISPRSEPDPRYRQIISPTPPHAPRAALVKLP
jgi:hypothetical protein